MDADPTVLWWKSPPRSPGRDPWLWSLAVPSVLSAAGLAAFGVFAIVRLIVTGPGQLDALIIAGAVLLGIGGELGTVFSTLEVFRKYLRGRTELRPNGEAIRADWLGLAVSFLTTVCKVALAYGAIFGSAALWPAFVFSPVTLALVLLEAGDAYVTIMEFGFYLASYDRRYERYIRAHERFLKGLYTAEDVDTALELPPAPLRRPTVADWRRIAESELGLTFESANMRAADVQLLLTDHGFAPVPGSTARRWATDKRTNGS